MTLADIAADRKRRKAELDITRSRSGVDHYTREIKLLEVELEATRKALEREEKRLARLEGLAELELTARGD